MSERLCRTLQPSYMKNFHCIGGACEHTCCSGWHIVVDQRSYERYMRIKDGELGELLAKSIIKNPAEKLKPQSYAQIHLDQGGLCPLLNEKKLCRLQAELGEKYLCNVCSTYPRIANSIDDMLERSLTLSCPEAARLALLNEDYMEFDEGQEDESARNIIQTTFSSQHQYWVDKPQSLFWQIRNFAIGLLQNREYPVWKRMVILGLCFENIQRQIDNHVGPSEISATIAAYDTHVHNGVYKDSMKEVPLNVMFKLRLVSEFFFDRLRMGRTDDLFGGSFHSLLQYLSSLDASTEQELTTSYLQANERYYQPFMDKHEYILENFLINYIFQSLFPISSMSFFQTYMQAAILFSIVNTMLVGLCLNSQDLTKEMFVDIIRVVSHNILHSPRYLVSMVEAMGAKQQDNMLYMATLIAN